MGFFGGNDHALALKKTINRLTEEKRLLEWQYKDVTNRLELEQETTASLEARLTKAKRRVRSIKKLATDGPVSAAEVAALQALATACESPDPAERLQAAEFILAHVRHMKELPS